jgi:PAS domain S-box-containing protein
LPDRVRANEPIPDGDDMSKTIPTMWRYAHAVIAVAIATAVRFALDPYLGDKNPYFVYGVAIAWNAWFHGLAPGFLALALSALADDYFFVVPRGSLAIAGMTNQAAFAVFVLLGLALIVITNSLREVLRRAQASEGEARRAFKAERIQMLRVRTTLASIADAVITTDADGRVTGLNRTAEQLTGWTTDEASGRPIDKVFRLVDEESLRTDEMPVAEIVGQGVVWRSSDSAMLICRDGRSLPVEHSTAPIQDDEGAINGMVLVFRDVTERCRSEQAMRASEERFRQLAEHSTDVFWVTDPHGAKVLYVSPAYEAVWGRSCQSLYNDWGSFLEAVHPDDRQRVRAAVESLACGRSMAEEYRVIRPDGTERWVWDRGFPIRDDTDQVVRVAGIAEDITDRKHGDAALRQSEQRFARFMQHLPGLAWIKGSQGRYVYANDAAARAFGLPIAMLYGRSDQEVFSPETAAAFREHDRRALETGTGIQVIETLQHEDGTVHHSLVSKFAIPSPDGDEVLVGGMAIDVTDRLEMEAALKDADRRKDEFLAMLAHELRNPLAPIAAALQLMKGQGSRQMEEERAMAEQQVQYMARLIDDLMDVSRISRGKVALQKEVVDLGAIVARSVGAAQPLLAERRHELIVSLPEKPLLLEGDPTRLEQVLANLLSNAAKYTDPAGCIRVTADRENGWAMVRVADTGIGIEPSVLPEVFGLFVQVQRRLDRSRGGLGIGLSLVKSLVEMHGGSVEAHSGGPGQGSEFVVRLPALDVEPDRGVWLPPGDGARPPSGIPAQRVLVVDDNVDAADSLGRLLSRFWSQDVRVVYDGPAAVEVARSFRPEVVFLDLGLPGMDGCEVARRLRCEPGLAGALLVALTGWGQESDREMSRAAGFDQHLVKPVEVKMLREVLSTPDKFDKFGGHHPQL